MKLNDDFLPDAALARMLEHLARLFDRNHVSEQDRDAIVRHVAVIVGLRLFSRTREPLNELLPGVGESLFSQPRSTR